MLGLFSILSLVLGAFVAGGGAFEWEFLFSDGRYEHDWVRSMGRGGARGLLVLLGSVLVALGFVGQVADAAMKPVAVAANTQAASGNPEESQPSGGSLPGGSLPDSLLPDGLLPGSPRVGTSKTSPPATKAPAVSGPSLDSTDAPPASYLPPASDRLINAAGGPQPVTIWNPVAEAQDGNTLVRIRYRFESGHQPLADVRYYWMIEAASQATEVEYESLQNQGELGYLLRVPLESSGLKQYWSTVLMVQIGRNRSQVSNRLQIVAGQVRATPMTTTSK